MSMSGCITTAKCTKCGYIISMGVSYDNVQEYKIRAGSNKLKFHCGNCGCGIEISHELVAVKDIGGSFNG